MPRRGRSAELHFADLRRLLHEGLHADCVVRVGPNEEPQPAHRLFLQRVPIMARALASGETVDDLVLTEAQVATAYASRGMLAFLRQTAGLAVGGKLESGASAEESEALADATLLSACGTRSFRIHRCLMAHRSEYFKASFAHADRQGEEALVRLPSPYATPELLALLLPFLYTNAPEERAALLADPDHVVAVAYLADLLLLPALREAALVLMRKGVTVDNAVSLFNVATELRDGGLRSQCMQLMIDNLSALTTTEYFGCLGEDIKRQLKLLSRASTANPLCINARLSDASEFMAMLRESIGEMRDRQAEALQRQHEAHQELLLDEQQVEAMTVGRYNRQQFVAAQLESLESKRQRLRKVDETIERSNQRIDFLVDFLRRQELIFGAVVHKQRSEDGNSVSNGGGLLAPVGGLPDSGSSHTGTEDPTTGAAAAEPVDHTFRPTYDWQELPRGQSVPMGLEVNLNMTTGVRFARIPSSWRLRVWVEEPSTTVRVDVPRDATVGQIKAAVAVQLGLPSDAARSILMTDSKTGAAVGADEATVAAARLFERQHSLRTRLDRAAQTRLWELSQAKGETR